MQRDTDPEQMRLPGDDVDTSSHGLGARSQPLSAFAQSSSATGANRLTLTAPDGTAIKTFRRSSKSQKASKATAARPRRTRRAGWRVIAGTRHSATGGRDRTEEARARFHAPQLNIDKVFELCNREGWNVVDTFALFNFSGTEMDHYHEYVERMELPLDHPDLLDAIVVSEWDRFSRNDVETPLLLDRIRKAGGAVVVVDQPNMDIYDDTQMPLIALVNAIAAQKPRTAAAKTRQVAKRRVEQGKALAPIYGWDKMNKRTEVTLADGSTRTLEQGHLWQNDAEFPFACQVLPKLWAKEPPKRVCAWLNANGQRMRPARRLDELGELIQQEGRPWDTDASARGPADRPAGTPQASSSRRSGRPVALPTSASVLPTPSRSSRSGAACAG